MRAAKLKGMGSVAASLQHCYRERETENADAALTPDNEHYGAKSTDEAMGKVRELLPEKRRKDAVLAVEYVLTASPEWWETATEEQQADFFARSRQWLADKYGAENIVTATIHRDETSPHMSAYVVPITSDGRLSAKDFIGGKVKLGRDQTTFAKAVEDLGLDRGLQGSKARHQTIKDHYAAISKPLEEAVEIDPSDLKPLKLKPETFLQRFFPSKESAEDIARRLSGKTNESIRPLVANAAESSQNRDKAKNYQGVAVTYREELNALKTAFRGLTRDQVKDVLSYAAELSKKNAKNRSSPDDPGKGLER